MIGSGSSAVGTIDVPHEITEFLIIKEMGWTYDDLDNLSYKRYQELIQMISGYNAGRNKPNSSKEDKSSAASFFKKGSGKRVR